MASLDEEAELPCRRAIATTVIASCPTASSTPPISSSKSTFSNSISSNAGAIAGEVIGALGFLVALIFLGMWFRLYRKQQRTPEYGQTFIQTSAPGNGNGRGVVLTPVVVTPCNGPASTQRIASWSLWIIPLCDDKQSILGFLVTHPPHKLSHPPNAMITSAKTSNQHCRCRFRETDPRWRPCPVHGRCDWPVLTIGETHSHIDDRRRVVRGGLVHYALMDNNNKNEYYAQRTGSHPTQQSLSPDPQLDRETS
ncbi:hypothetical protein J3R30DRAFT_3709558 [Lentinula aciculospora]|uniref:Uncharacterized protein n=1 Tax=Lentinula aciculospora TaxID=153920 RepID=A0A9W9DIG0_9AGAR|nr:hypothetical protein J3R30DRAFT_3709558 [Lentinula aciculospora]